MRVAVLQATSARHRGHLRKETKPRRTPVPGEASGPTHQAGSGLRFAAGKEYAVRCLQAARVARSEVQGFGLIARMREKASPFRSHVVTSTDHRRQGREALQMRRAR